MKRIYFAVIIILLISAFSYAEEKRYTIPVNDSPSFGPADAAITIIEFLDFQ